MLDFSAIVEDSLFSACERITQKPIVGVYWMVVHGKMLAVVISEPPTMAYYKAGLHPPSLVFILRPTLAPDVIFILLPKIR